MKKLPEMTARPIKWAQINLQAFEDLSKLIGENKNAAKLLLRLMKHMRSNGTDGAVIVASRQTMAELMGGWSLTTIDRALKVLYTGGWVQRLKIGGAFALAVNSRVAWTANRKNLQFAAFTATIIVSRNEQDAIALDPPPLKELPVFERDELPAFERDELALMDEPALIEEQTPTP